MWPPDEPERARWAARLSARTRALLDGADVWDMVYQAIPELGNTYEALERFRAAGVTHVSLTLAGDDQKLDDAIRWVAAARAYLQARPDLYRLVEAREDFAAAKAAGQLAVTLHFEGTECFERNLDVVGLFHRLGVRQTLIAFNKQNSAGGGCAEPNDSGLTRYGRALVREMERVGMLIDLAHVGERTSLDVCAMVANPVIFSHCNAKKLYAHWRNITDAQARACAQTGGVVGVSGSTMYLGVATPEAEEIFRHIDHYCTLIGPRHVGLGLDTFFDGPGLRRILLQKPEEWPDLAEAPLHYSIPEQIPLLAELMVQAGYADQDIRAILGGNFKRVCEHVWWK